MALVLNAAATPTGEPSITVQSCQCVFANIDVKVHGSMLRYTSSLGLDCVGVVLYF